MYVQFSVASPARPSHALPVIRVSHQKKQGQGTGWGRFGVRRWEAGPPQVWERVRWGLGWGEAGWESIVDWVAWSTGPLTWVGARWRWQAQGEGRVAWEARTLHTPSWGRRMQCTEWGRAAPKSDRFFFSQGYFGGWRRGDCGVFDSY